MPRAEGSALGPGGEFDRIRRILAAAPRSGSDVLIPAGDDAAVLASGPWAVSVDMAVEDVHFRRDWLSGREVAFRAVMAAVSDMAAMAADPRAVLASIAVPADDDYTVELGDGLAEACSFLGVALVGGDLTRSPGPIVIDTVVLGRVDDPVSRRGALPGDEVWITGVLGGPAAAVRMLEAGTFPGPELRETFSRPIPRVAEARWLKAEVELRGLIDLSDGLGADAGHLAAASGVGITLDWTSVPVDPNARMALGDPLARELAISGGEDYELCCVLPPDAGDASAPEFRVKFGLPLTRVGWVHEGTGVHIVDSEGREHTATGFDHFPGDGNE